MDLGGFWKGDKPTFRKGAPAVYANAPGYLAGAELESIGRGKCGREVGVVVFESHQAALASMPNRFICAQLYRRGDRTKEHPDPWWYGWRGQQFLIVIYGNLIVEVGDLNFGPFEKVERQFWQAAETLRAALATEGPATRPAATTQSGSSQQLPLGEGDRTSVAGTEYVLKCLHGAEITEAVPGRICLWHNGELLIIDPYRPQLDDRVRSRWKIVGLSASRTRAVVMVEKKAGELPTYGVANLRKGELLGTFDGLEGSQWAFSADERFAFPIAGMGRAGWVYFDAAKRAGVARKLLDTQKQRPKNDWHYWCGAVLADGKSICLFGCSSGRRRHAMMRFDRDAPERATIRPGGTPVCRVVDVRPHELLCEIPDDRLAALSTKTWELGTPKGRAHLHAAGGRPDPSGKYAYWIDRHEGLFIYDRRTAESVDLPRADSRRRDGWTFNAQTLGATFTTDGRVAVVATPYQSRLTFIDTARHTVIRRIYTYPLAGAFLVEPDKQGRPGTCLVVVTTLPYE